MDFMNIGHFERYHEALYGSIWADDNDKVDRYYGAAHYLLTLRSSIWLKSKDYVSDGIYFDKMLAEQDFTSGELPIVMLAFVLFKNVDSAQFSLTNMIAYLGDEEFDCCITAIGYFRSDSFKLASKKPLPLGNE